MTFSVGNRVIRPIDTHNYWPKGFRHGKVIKCYSKEEEHFPCIDLTLGPYPELFDVQWDSGEIGYGFLPHGLIREYMLCECGYLSKSDEEATAHHAMTGH